MTLRHAVFAVLIALLPACSDGTAQAPIQDSEPPLLAVPLLSAGAWKLEESGAALANRDGPGELLILDLFCTAYTRNKAGDILRITDLRDFQVVQVFSEQWYHPPGPVVLRLRSGLLTTAIATAYASDQGVDGYAEADDEVLDSLLRRWPTRAANSRSQSSTRPRESPRTERVALFRPME